MVGALPVATTSAAVSSRAQDIVSPARGTRRTTLSSRLAAAPPTLKALRIQCGRGRTPVALVGEEDEAGADRSAETHLAESDDDDEGGNVAVGAQVAHPVAELLTGRGDIGRFGCVAHRQRADAYGQEQDQGHDEEPARDAESSRGAPGGQREGRERRAAWCCSA